MEHNIGKTIAALRKEKGFTQAELAQRLKVSDKAVSKWEIGDGFPSIEFFPALANVFGVTTDYLLTGVKQEPQKTCSDLELCVKSGNIQRALKLYGERDENGKSVLDYAIDYKNVDMVTMMLSPDGYLIRSRRNKNNGQRTAVIVEDMSCAEQTRFLKELLGEYSLCEYYSAVLKLLPLNLERDIAKMVYYYNETNSYYARRRGFVFKQELRENGAIDDDTNASAQSEIKEICDYLIKNYEALPEEQKDYYFGKTDHSTKRFECWKFAYPDFIACAYEHGATELFKKLLKNYEEKVYTAAFKFDLTTLLKPLMHSYENNKDAFNLIYTVFKEDKGVWEKEPEFLKFILNVYKKYGKAEGDKLNIIAGNHYSEDEIRCFYIENDKTKTKAQKLEEKCAYKGILWIDRALETDDAAFVKRMFKNYALTLAETLENDVKCRNYEKLFKFAADNVCEKENCGFDGFLLQILKAASFADAAKIPEFVAEYGQSSIDGQFVYNDGAVFDAIPKTLNNDNLLSEILKANLERLTDYNTDLAQKEYCSKNKISGDMFRSSGYYRRGAYERRVPDLKHNVINDFLNGYKTEILSKLTAAEEAKNAKTDDGKFNYLTKEYFSKLLKESDVETVVIKLCVKLEAYFKFNLGYAGNLYEMMDRYCDKIGQNSLVASTLNNLRKARNSVTHAAEKTKITENEVNGYIETVFKITEEK